MSSEKIEKFRDKLIELGEKAKKESDKQEVSILKVIMQQKAIMYYEIANALAETILDN